MARRQAPPELVTGTAFEPPLETSEAAVFSLRTTAEQCVETLARHDEAGVALRRALELAPDHLGARLTRAANLAALGDIEGAAAAWRAAIAVAPVAAQAWLGLVDLKTTRLSDDELAALEAP